MNKEESIQQIETLIEAWQLDEADLNQTDINAMQYLLKENQKLEQALDENKKLINTILNFDFFKEECPLNFSFEDNSKEDKAQNIFYNDEYCENNCNDNYKDCWLKYFKELQELEGSDSNVKK